MEARPSPFLKTTRERRHYTYSMKIALAPSLRRTAIMALIITSPIWRDQPEEEPADHLLVDSTKPTMARTTTTISTSGIWRMRQEEATTTT
jgi:hypothetical protein